MALSCGSLAAAESNSAIELYSGRGFRSTNVLAVTTEVRASVSIRATQMDFIMAVECEILCSSFRYVCALQQTDEFHLLRFLTTCRLAATTHGGATVGQSTFSAKLG